MLRSAHQQSITNRGDEFERLDEIIKQNKDFQFYFDYTHNFFKLNPLIPRSQTFLIEDNKILCGSPLDNKMIMNIFIDYIKNKYEKNSLYMFITIGIILYLQRKTIFM